MWHSDLCFHYSHLPSLIPTIISSDRHWREKRLCSGVNELECLARYAFKRGQTLRGRREPSLCKGWAPTERRTRDTWALLAISVSICAVQLTQLGPIYNSERVGFPPTPPPDWSAGCFTFRVLNKQEIKRTSNKTTNRAPHIIPLSWEAQCESLWGVGVPGVVHP